MGSTIRALRSKTGKANVSPAVPPHSLAARLMPWRTPTSKDSSCSGAGAATTQMAPTSALLFAALPRTLSPFTSATAPE